MRPKPDAMRLSQFDDAVHGVGVTRMKARRDIGGTDDFHNLLVRGVTKHPLTKTFTHVAIQIDDLFHDCILFLVWGHHRMPEQN